MVIGREIEFDDQILAAEENTAKGKKLLKKDFKSAYVIEQIEEKWNNLKMTCKTVNTQYTYTSVLKIIKDSRIIKNKFTKIARVIIAFHIRKPQFASTFFFIKRFTKNQY